MEPSKTHGAPLPPQELTHSAGGCPSGPRPGDLMLGGHEGANPHAGQRAAISEVVDSATASTLQAPGVFANTRGDDCESGPSNTKVLTRLDAFKLFKGKARDLAVEARIKLVFDYFGPQYHLSQTSEQFKGVLAAFLTKSSDLLKRCKGNEHFFLKKHGTWLGGTLISGNLKIAEGNEDNLSPKSKKFKTLSRVQQYRSKRKLQEVLEDNPSSNKIKAFIGSLKINDKALSHTSAKSLETIINLCLSSDTASTEILKKIEHSIQPYTPEEALSILIDRNLSVETYNKFYFDMKNRGNDIYPPYYRVQEAKKKCYPDQVQVSEREALVPVKNLVRHTFDRILSLTDAVFINFCTHKDIQTVECVLKGIWGFDGSTGQSLYKQKFSDAGVDENCMFATTFTPLQISTNTGDVIWMNPSPQSYRYCRPVHIQYEKESQNLINSEKQLVQNQIDNLTPMHAKTSEGHQIKIKCELYCAAIDGKVLNTLLNTKSQLRCPYCQLTSSQFNNLDTVFSSSVDESLLRYGVSPLHFWIRALEFVLKLGYKVKVKQWRIPQKSAEHKLVEDRKAKIQEEIRDKLGLLVDVVRPTSGTTNDGNTARTAFSDRNRATFADILDIEKWLLDDLYIISIVLSSNLPIDVEKFASFCNQLAHRYVENYNWHPMSVTIHKVLAHGAQIIAASPLPVGMMSEQAAESRNKFWRFDREYRSRKVSREATMFDLFHRALISSDPVISDFNLKDRNKSAKRIPLPPEALSLLKPVDMKNVLVDDHSSFTEHNEETLIIQNEQQDL